MGLIMDYSESVNLDRDVVKDVRGFYFFFFGIVCKWWYFVLYMGIVFFWILVGVEGMNCFFDEMFGNFYLILCGCGVVFF